MNTAELSCICKQVRRDIINMTANAGSVRAFKLSV